MTPKSRDYYRALPKQLLLEEAQIGLTHEMAIAIAELWSGRRGFEFTKEKPNV